jgi:hypothetical protein
VRRGRWRRKLSEIMAALPENTPLCILSSSSSRRFGAVRVSLRIWFQTFDAGLVDPRKSVQEQLMVVLSGID